MGAEEGARNEDKQAAKIRFFPNFLAFAFLLDPRQGVMLSTLLREHQARQQILRDETGQFEKQLRCMHGWLLTPF